MRNFLLRHKASFLIRYHDLMLKLFGRYRSGGLLQRITRFNFLHFIRPYPHVIKLDLTGHCNLSCRMCYQHSEAQTSLADLKKIIDNFKTVPVRLDLLGGEPLMFKEIIPLLKYIRDETLIHEIVLYTNATLVTPEMAAELKTAGLSKAIVTLVSHREDVHDEFTGHSGSYQKTISGIRELVSAGISTWTFTALHSVNIAQYREIHDFVKKELNIRPLFYQYISQSVDDPLSVPPLYWQRIKSDILNNYSGSHFNRIQSIINICGQVCLGGLFSFSIKIDGTVTPCPFIDDIRLGNILEEDFWTIFRMRSRVESFREFKSVPNSCRTCSYLKLCGRGCKAGNSHMAGGYKNMDQRCLGPHKGPITREGLIKSLPTFF